MEANTLHCDRHGLAEKAIVCQHLLQPGEGGYYVVPAEAGDPAQAWCEICERARIADRGWYDYADGVAQWLLVCTECMATAVENRPLMEQCAGRNTPDERPPV
jgi:hypothetical protein